MKKYILILSVLAVIFTSCEKNNDEPDVTPAMARDTLYAIMDHFYYWYDKMPSVTVENYEDPYNLLEALRYRPYDKWSYIADYDEFLAQSQGSFVGHGFKIGLGSDMTARVAMVFNKSELYAKGVRRGWIVKKINGVDIAPILISGNGKAYSDLIGPSEAGVTNQFVMIKPDGTEVSFSATKSTFTVNTVIHYDTLHLKSGIAGHLVFEEFINPSEEELRTAFKFFSENNATDVILDLRYNLGGLLNVSQTLATYLAGNGYTSTIFAKLAYNDKNQGYNSTYNFRLSEYPQNLQRIAIITSYSTASASELIINGLDPLMTVVTIGDTTRGKPMGMNVWSCCKKYMFLPVTFKTVNSLNQGEYYDGIAPDCLAADDIRFDFPDRNEESLKQAISWLEKGTFIAGKNIFAAPVKIYGERNNIFNNLIVPDK